MMHELGVTEDLLAHVLEHASEAGIKRVTVIKLSLGEMSDIVPDSVRLYFETVSKDTAAEGAELIFTPLETELRCRHCGASFQAFQPGDPCPECGQTNLEVLNGQGFYLQSIEGEEDD